MYGRDLINENWSEHVECVRHVIIIVRRSFFVHFFNFYVRFFFVHLSRAPRISDENAGMIGNWINSAWTPPLCVIVQWKENLFVCDDEMKSKKQFYTANARWCRNGIDVGSSSSSSSSAPSGEAMWNVIRMHFMLSSVLVLIAWKVIDVHMHCVHSSFKFRKCTWHNIYSDDFRGDWTS